MKKFFNNPNVQVVFGIITVISIIAFLVKIFYRGSEDHKQIADKKPMKPVDRYERDTVPNDATHVNVNVPKKFR